MTFGPNSTSKLLKKKKIREDTYEDLCLYSEKKIKKPNESDDAAFLSTILSEMYKHYVFSFILTSEKEK